MDRAWPTNVFLGSGAIALILLVASWPRWWWVPALDVLESAIHTTTAWALGLQPSWWGPSRYLLNHWSARYLFGVNIYPWVTLPLFTLAFEVLWRWRWRDASGSRLRFPA